MVYVSPCEDMTDLGQPADEVLGIESWQRGHCRNRIAIPAKSSLQAMTGIGAGVAVWLDPSCWQAYKSG